MNGKDLDREDLLRLRVLTATHVQEMLLARSGKVTPKVKAYHDLWTKIDRIMGVDHFCSVESKTNA